LSGSSAIVTAAFRALLKFHHLPLQALGLSLNTLPEVILGCEVRELNISAGLQDRVVQTFGGLVYMDFHQDHFDRDNHGKYESLDLELLPTLYLAYSTKLGGESGKVHAPVKQRFNEGDEFITMRMKVSKKKKEAPSEQLVERTKRGAKATRRSVAFLFDAPRLDSPAPRYSSVTNKLDITGISGQHAQERGVLDEEEIFRVR